MVVFLIHLLAPCDMKLHIFLSKLQLFGSLSKTTQQSLLGLPRGRSMLFTSNFKCSIGIQYAQLYCVGQLKYLPQFFSSSLPSQSLTKSQTLVNLFIQWLFFPWHLSSFSLHGLVASITTQQILR